MLSLMLSLMAAAPVKVAALTPNAVGLEQSLADAMIERFATQLALDGELSVTSARDVSQVLGVERQQQLLGCGASSCAAELAAALGVDVLLTTSFAKIGETITLTIRALDAKNANVIAQEAHRDADVDGLQDWLDAVKLPIATTIRRAKGRTANTPSTLDEQRLTAAWVTAISSLALGIGGVTLTALSQADAATLKTSSTLTLTDIDSLERSGVVKRWAGVALFAAAGAGLTAALILFSSAALPEAPSSTSLTFKVMPLAGGAFASLGGTW